tara:strand:+ start:96 stop:1040 length:945 start_codon:yes stop_codon:yes gene_type:complete
MPDFFIIIITIILSVFFTIFISKFLNKKQPEGENSEQLLTNIKLILDPIDTKVKSLSDLFSNPIKLGKAVEKPLVQWLEGVGYIKNEEFTTQMSTEGHGTPDLVFFNAYGDKELIIDSKLPTENFKNLKNAQDSGNDKEFELNHKQFGLDVIEQIKQCEKYLKKPDSLDLVLMYIASPSIYQYIIENRFYSVPSAKSPDISLQEYSEEKKVVLVSPQLLFVILEHIKIVKDNFQIIEAQEELQKAHSDFIEQWENWTMTVDKIQNSVDDIIKKINQDRAGGLNFEIRQFRDGRFNELKEKVDVMKKLLENKKKS